MGKRLNGRLLTAVISMLVIFYNYFLIIAETKTDYVDFSRIWMQGRGFFYLWENISFVQLMFALMPGMLILSCFAVTLSNDIARNAQYIFVRSNHRIEFLLNKCRLLLTQYIKMKALLTVFELVCIRVLSSEKVLTGIQPGEVAINIIFSIFSEYTLILLSNMTALQFNDLTGYISAISMYAVCYIAFCFMYTTQRKVLWWLPFIQSKAVFSEMLLAGSAMLYLLIVFLYGSFIINKKEFY